MTSTTTQFDPWDWLGVHCGGYFPELDRNLMGVLSVLHRRGRLSIKSVPYISSAENCYAKFICTLLCNTDAFEFDTDPSQLRWVGDDRFQTLDQLIEAWEAWYQERYS